MSTLYFGSDNSSYPESIHIPLLHIRYKERSDPIVRAFLDDFSDYTHLVFTSKHGVEAVFQQVCSDDIADKQVVSVGAMTTRALLAQGCTNISTASKETQEGILHLLNVMDLRGAYIGIPCSSRARGMLSSLLAYRGVRHVVGHVYDTELVEGVTLPHLEEVQTLIFTSPSTVDAFQKYVSTLPSHIQVRVKGEVTRARFQHFFSKTPVLLSEN